MGDRIEEGWDMSGNETEMAKIEVFLKKFDYEGRREIVRRRWCGIWNQVMFCLLKLVPCTASSFPHTHSHALRIIHVEPATLRDPG